MQNQYNKIKFHIIWWIIVHSNFLSERFPKSASHALKWVKTLILMIILKNLLHINSLTEFLPTYCKVKLTTWLINLSDRTLTLYL